MPRELGSSKVPVQLTESPNPAEESEQRQASPSEGRWIRQLSGFGRSGTRDPNALHTFVRPLTISDLEACVTLENAAFENPQERCSREKVRSLSADFNSGTNFVFRTGQRSQGAGRPANTLYLRAIRQPRC